jgi:hypothetical protein
MKKVISTELVAYELVYGTFTLLPENQTNGSNTGIALYSVPHKLVNSVATSGGDNCNRILFGWALKSGV